MNNKNRKEKIKINKTTLKKNIIFFSIIVIISINISGCTIVNEFSKTIKNNSEIKNSNQTNNLTDKSNFSTTSNTINLSTKNISNNFSFNITNKSILNNPEKKSEYIKDFELNLSNNKSIPKPISNLSIDKWCLIGEEFSNYIDNITSNSTIIGITNYENATYCKAESTIIIGKSIGYISYYINEKFNEMWIETTIFNETSRTHVYY